MTPPFCNNNIMFATQTSTLPLPHVTKARTSMGSEMPSSASIAMASSHSIQQSNAGDGSSLPESRGADVANADVGELVVKAKKAAASLWMILHAQNCNIPNCPYPQCSETQNLLDHVQTCPVADSPSSPCPVSCKGCNETRKLLAHYHKCKELRSNQTNTEGNQYPKQTSCLVCSIMARHAKNFTERSRKTQAAMPPPPRQRPRSESFPELKSPERKSRTVKFAPCLRTTRYYHPEKDKSYCVPRRPRSLSWGSNVMSEMIEEEDSDKNCS